MAMHYLRVEVLTPTGLEGAGLFEVVLKTNLKVFDEQHAVAKRRYSHFVWLRRHLRSRLPLPPQDQRHQLQEFLAEVASDPKHQVKECLHVFFQPSVSPESMDWLVRLDGRHHSSSNGDSLEHAAGGRAAGEDRRLSSSSFNTATSASSVEPSPTRRRIVKYQPSTASTTETSADESAAGRGHRGLPRSAVPSSGALGDDAATQELLAQLRLERSWASMGQAKGSGAATAAAAAASAATSATAAVTTTSATTDAGKGCVSPTSTVGSEGSAFQPLPRKSNNTSLNGSGLEMSAPPRRQQRATASAFWVPLDQSAEDGDARVLSTASKEHAAARAQWFGGAAATTQKKKAAAAAAAAAPVTGSSRALGGGAMVHDRPARPARPPPPATSSSKGREGAASYATSHEAARYLIRPHNQQSAWERSLRSNLSHSAPRPHSGAGAHSAAHSGGHSAGLSTRSHHPPTRARSADRAGVSSSQRTFVAGDYKPSVRGTPLAAALNLVHLHSGPPPGPGVERLWTELRPEPLAFHDRAGYA